MNVWRMIIYNDDSCLHLSFVKPDSFCNRKHTLCCLNRLLSEARDWWYQAEHLAQKQPRGTAVPFFFSNVTMILIGSKSWSQVEVTPNKIDPISICRFFACSIQLLSFTTHCPGLFVDVANHSEWLPKIIQLLVILLYRLAAAAGRDQDGFSQRSNQAGNCFVHCCKATDTTDTTDKAGLLDFMIFYVWFTLLHLKLLIDADPFDIVCLDPVVCAKRLLMFPCSTSQLLGGRTWVVELRRGAASVDMPWPERIIEVEWLRSEKQPWGMLQPQSQSNIGVALDY